MLTIIGLHVNEKYGQGILGKLIMGKYLRPREEERIFMFVDIRSSTTIAEQLGHLRFFELLNDFYRDLTNPIIYKSGEIYQYVGDEIVVSWPMKEGLHNASCLRCFYDIKATLETLSGEYKKVWPRSCRKSRPALRPCNHRRDRCDQKDIVFREMS